MTQIKKVEIHEFTHSVKNLGLLTNANTIGAVGYAKGQITKMDKYAIVVETDDGCRGEYVTHWGGNQAACAQSKMLAPKLLEYNYNRINYSSLSAGIHNLVHSLVSIYIAQN